MGGGIGSIAALVVDRSSKEVIFNVGVVSFDKHKRVTSGQMGFPCLGLFLY